MGVYRVRQEANMVCLIQTYNGGISNLVTVVLFSYFV